MTRELIGAAAISLVLLIAILIFLSNRSVRRAQESIMPAPAPSLTSEHRYSAFYVSTVFVESALTRVWAHGLGSRGKAFLAIEPAGLSVSRQGERGFLIPTKHLIGLTRASATIDKGVERDGLLVVIWQLGEDRLATHFRVVDPEKRKQIESLIKEVTGVEIE